MNIAEQNTDILVSDTTDDYELRLLRDPKDNIIFWRKSKRSKIINRIGQYTINKNNGDTSFDSLTVDVGKKIIQRILAGEHFSSSFVFNENESEISNQVLKSLKEKSQMEHTFTSTGSKFWLHKDALESYKNNTGHSIISTHISPEGTCNLACPYCSVSFRKKKNRLSMALIEKYVIDLKSRGLKAVILTGGGEPTLYPEFDQLLELLYGHNLKVALITNGTQLRKLNQNLLKKLSWLRVSINIFPDWQTKIDIPDELHKHTTLGMSFVYTSQHQQANYELLPELEAIKKIAAKANAKYVRLLPNCLLDQKTLIHEHIALSKVLAQLDDKRFFHQKKLHGAPKSNICHQSYFRPYLSEEPYPGSTTAGSVFPCDSVVLNNDIGHFNQQYVLCKPENILAYLDKEIKSKFKAKQCKGCVFTSNINMLADYVEEGIEHFSDLENTSLDHAEFI